MNELKRIRLELLKEAVLTIVLVALFLGLAALAFEHAGAHRCDDDSTTDDTYVHTPWRHDIENKENAAYVVEVAFNLDIPVDSVTQEQFNNRYLND